MSRPLVLAVGDGGVHLAAMHEPLEAILAHGQLDAIVSSDDTRLSMTGTVAAAVRRMAGDGYAGPARRLLPLQVGDIAVSGAGRLAARYVFHAITADWERGIRPTERIVRGVAARLFTRAEVLRAHTIAIPVAVSGATSLTPEATTRLIVEALADHVANGTELKLVMFPLVDPKSFEAIVREVQAARAAEKTPAGTPTPARAEATTARFPALPKWTRRGKPTAKKKAAEGPASAPPAAESDDPPPRFMGFDPTDPGVRPVLVGRYVLLEQLGRGSMGIVHLAWDLILRRNLAIKIVRPEWVDAAGLREAAMVAQGLDHPAIVRVHHYDSSDRRGPFLASEYLPWNTGERVIADAGQSLLPVASVIGIGLQLCEALDYAHRQGVLHLDIKPGNVFVDATLERAKLADFGWATVIASPEERTRRLERAGTTGYTAPEQWVPGGTPTVATDLYQLAATLWDFLVGTPPKLPFEVPRGLTHERQALLENLKRALVRDVGERPRHAREFQELLSAHANVI